MNWEQGSRESRNPKSKDQQAQAPEPLQIQVHAHWPLLIKNRNSSASTPLLALSLSLIRTSRIRSIGINTTIRCSRLEDWFLPQISLFDHPILDNNPTLSCLGFLFDMKLCAHNALFSHSLIHLNSLF